MRLEFFYARQAILCAVVLSAAVALGEDSTPSVSPAPDVPIVRLTQEGPDVPWDAWKVGDFELVDHLGRPVTNETLKGKPWVANFVFTRCTFECPKLLGTTYRLLKRLKDVDFRVVTITVDPEHDTVERLKSQAAQFEIDPDRWLFVTGPKDKVYNLIQKGFKQPAWERVGSEQLPGMEFVHSMSMVQVDKDGIIVGKYNGMVEDEIETLAKVLEGKIPVPAMNKPAAITTEKPKTVAGAAPDRGPVPEWVTRLPGTNAMLNTLAFLLLIGGRSAIRVGNVRLHSKLMIYAFVTSMVFLASYLTYHGALQHYTGEGSRKYAGEGILRPFYYTILVTHVILAALVPFGAIAAISLAFRKKFDAHKRLVKFVYPLWVYVSVTGVVIYLMLYQLPTKI